MQIKWRGACRVHRHSRMLISVCVCAAVARPRARRGRGPTHGAPVQDGGGDRVRERRAVDTHTDFPYGPPTRHIYMQTGMRHVTGGAGTTASHWDVNVWRANWGIAFPHVARRYHCDVADVVGLLALSTPKEV